MITSIISRSKKKKAQDAGTGQKERRKERKEGEKEKGRKERFEPESVEWLWGHILLLLL